MAIVGIGKKEIWRFDMVRESLARKFHSAGFEQPEGSRKNYVRPRRELQEAFYQWMGDLPYGIYSDLSFTELHYERAKRLLEENKITCLTSLEANSLLLGLKIKTKRGSDIGLFLSACYNLSDEDVIIFDEDAEDVNLIGYNCSKPLINNGRVRNDFGYRSSNFIINNCMARRRFAGSSSGPAINNGDLGGRFGMFSLGLLINNGTSEKGPCIKRIGFGNLRMNPDDCDKIPGLKDYLERLRAESEKIKDVKSARTFIEKHGPEPKVKIENDIKEMLKKGGYKV